MRKYLSLLAAVILLFTMAGCRRKEKPQSTVPTEVIVLPLPTAEPMTIPTEEETEPVETTEEETEAPTEAETVPETTQKEVGAPGKIVGANFVNVRKNPGVNQERVTRLAYGTKVNVYETVKHDNAIWGRIDEGWVSMEYVLLDSVADSYYYKHSTTATTAPTEETAPEETKPEESKPEESKPEESKPEESKPDESKPTEPTEPKPTDPKPTEPAPTDPKPTDPAPTESKPTTPPATEGTPAGGEA